MLQRGGHVPGHAEIVRDEQHGQVQVALQIPEQVEDLHLHGELRRASTCGWAP